MGKLVRAQVQVMDEQQLTTAVTMAAKTLARWCYARGLDERLPGCGEQLRRLAVDQALGRPAPAHLEQALCNKPPPCSGSAATGTATTR